MKAIIYKCPHTLEYSDVVKPSISENDVLIKIKSVGICGTDIHIYNGGMDLPTPLIMGHEFSGEVESVGDNVKNIKSGDRVVGEHVVFCGKCRYCIEGKPNLCVNAKVIGLDLPGALAEYIAIPKELVYKIPENISYEEAALIEPLTIALYAIKDAGVLLDKNIVVIGQGPIGLLIDQAIKSSGGNVIGIESQEHRLNFAKDNGWINFGINSSKENVNDVIKKEFPLGVDIVFEAVGKEATAKLALDISAKSGRVFLLGVFEQLSTLNLMMIVKKELYVHGSWTCAFTFPEAIDLVAEKKIDLKSMITHRYMAIDAIKAFEEASKYTDNRIKTVINF